MDRKHLACPRIALVVLVIAATAGAALPANAHDRQPPPDPAYVLDNSPRDPVADPAELPVSLPNPVYSGGMLAPSATLAISGDDRDNSTPTAWYIWAHQTPSDVTNTINLGYRLVDIYVRSD